MNVRDFPWFFGVAVVLFGCGASDSSPESNPDKGPEEEALSDGDGKTDSFFKPTEHGVLPFGSKQNATIESGSTFHSWNFTLSGEASLELTTGTTGNLDTVLYLFRREPGTATWGKQIEKNDDHAGNLWSQISRKADAGEYRVVVKALKSAMTGPFTMSGTCTGAGCPKIENCSSQERVKTPASTSYAASCAGQIQQVLAAPVTAVQEYSLKVGQCDAGALAKTAVDFYRSFWGNVCNWETFTNCDDAECAANFEMKVTLEQHGTAGTLVGVDSGFDETAMTYLFDAKGNVLMHYQSNQSPDVGWYCAAAGETALEEPDSDCLSYVLSGLSHREDTVKKTSGKTTLSSSTQDISKLATQALVEFTTELKLSDSEQVSYEAEAWKAGENNGLRIKLTHGSDSITYEAADGWLGVIVLTRTAGSSVTFLCTQE